MENSTKLTVIIWKEVDQYVSLCPEIDVSSFGDTKEEAEKNLKEAIELYFEDEEIENLPKKEVALVTQIPIKFRTKKR